MEVYQEFVEDTTAWSKLTHQTLHNYFLIEQIVHEFGDTDLKKSMEDYKERLNTFRCKAYLCNFANTFTKINTLISEEYLYLLTMELNQQWEKCTLESLEIVTKEFASKHSIPLHALTLKEIKLDTMLASWAVATVVSSSLKENMNNIDQSEFCKEYGILSIMLCPPALPKRSPFTQRKKEY